MKFWTNSRREWMLIGVLIGVIITIAAFALQLFISIKNAQTAYENCKESYASQTFSKRTCTSETTYFYN